MKGNLLIVEDEELLAENMCFLLKSYTEQIFIAHNGFEALKVLKRESIHCVVCDISMPQMNGVQLIKRAREEGKAVPFIFYTAYGHSELMMEVAKYGAFDFLNKPNFEGLQEVVTRGLKEGFNRKSETESHSDMLTEYEKILQQFASLSKEKE